MTRVLPEPAPARTSSGPSVVIDRLALRRVERGEVEHRGRGAVLPRRRRPGQGLTGEPGDRRSSRTRGGPVIVGRGRPGPWPAALDGPRAHPRGWKCPQFLGPVRVRSDFAPAGRPVARAGRRCPRRGETWRATIANSCPLVQGRLGSKPSLQRLDHLVLRRALPALRPLCARRERPAGPACTCCRTAGPSTRPRDGRRLSQAGTALAPWPRLAQPSFASAAARSAGSGAVTSTGPLAGDGKASRTAWSPWRSSSSEGRP